MRIVLLFLIRASKRFIGPLSLSFNSLHHGFALIYLLMYHGWRVSAHPQIIRRRRIIWIRRCRLGQQLFPPLNVWQPVFVQQLTLALEAAEDHSAVDS
jgi:hypothetical protein